MFLKFNYINKVICSFIILFLFTIRANAELKIDITSGYTEPTPIGISEFTGTNDEENGLQNKLQS